MLTKVIFLISSVASLAFASGGKNGGGVDGPPGAAEVRVSNEFVPPGGTVQVKFSFTNPTPIMSGGTGMACAAVFGVSLWSPSGDAAGVAVERDGYLYISALSPLADLGTNTDYPFLTVTMKADDFSKPGTASAVNPSMAFETSDGPLPILVKPGTIATGGAFWIHGVTPGGGTYPAGTTIRIEGSGFTANAQLRLPSMKISSFKVLSPTEIDVTLKEQTKLDGQAVQVTVGGVTQTYYSYLRGTLLQASSRSFLKAVEPIFPLQTHVLAKIETPATPMNGMYTGLALQNANPGPAAITLNLNHADGTVESSSIVLPSGYRLVDELGALVNGAVVRPGDSFNLISTAPIQAVGLHIDETAGTATAFLPVF